MMSVIRAVDNFEELQRAMSVTTVVGNTSFIAELLHSGEWKTESLEASLKWTRVYIKQKRDKSTLKITRMSYVDEYKYFWCKQPRHTKLKKQRRRKGKKRYYKNKHI